MIRAGAGKDLEQRFHKGLEGPNLSGVSLSGNCLRQSSFFERRRIDITMGHCSTSVFVGGDVHRGPRGRAGERRCRLYPRMGVALPSEPLG
jgi:hypothetical protein